MWHLHLLFPSYLQQIWRARCHTPLQRQTKPGVLSKSQTSDSGSRDSWCPAEAWTGLANCAHCSATIIQSRSTNSWCVQEAPPKKKKKKPTSWNMIKCVSGALGNPSRQLIQLGALSPFRDARGKKVPRAAKKKVRNVRQKTWTNSTSRCCVSRPQEWHQFLGNYWGEVLSYEWGPCASMKRSARS